MEQCYEASEMSFDSASASEAPVAKENVNLKKALRGCSVLHQLVVVVHAMAVLFAFKTTNSEEVNDPLLHPTKSKNSQRDECDWNHHWGG